MLAFAAAILVACGSETADGSDEGSDAGTTTAPSTTGDASGDDGSGSDDASGNETGGDADAGNYAIVTIAGTDYEVPVDELNLCNSLGNIIFGSFAIDSAGNATQAGGTDVSVQVNFGLPAPDWQEQGLQPPILDVDLREEGSRWWASVERGIGSVDSWELNDGMATGSATFTSETTGSGEITGTETGTFEIVCR